MIGQLALLGIPVVLGGAVRAKGPCHVVVLHRHILLEALSKPEQPEHATHLIKCSYGIYTDL